MPRRRHGPKDAQAERPATPYLPDGTLDPQEWKIACTAVNVLALVLVGSEPWFVEARPVEVPGQGVELEVVVRWLSSEVREKVPAKVDGYVVNIVVHGQADEVHTLH